MRRAPVGHDRPVRTRLRRPWPLRAQLTIAFASVIALVLAATGMLVYSEFRRDVDRGIDEDLARRSVAFRRLSAGEVQPARIIALAGERFAQVYGPGGAVTASSRALDGDRLLTPAQVRAAATGPLRVVRVPVAGTQSGVRVAAFPSTTGGSRRWRSRATGATATSTGCRRCC